LIVRSFRRLEIESYSSRQRRIQLLRNIPSFRLYISQKYSTNLIWHSVSPPLFAFNFSALFPIPQFDSFEFEGSSSKGREENLAVSTSEIRNKFQDFAAPLINDGILLFTDGSRRDDEDSAVGAAVYSPELGIAIKHKLPPETSVFSAEAWTVYQALILVESSSYPEAAIFSDSKSVLDALSSFSFKSSSNYLIPLIRDKFHTMTDNEFTIRLA